MASAYDKASLVMLPHATKEGKLYSVKPEDRSGDFTFSRGTSATRVNSSGLIEKERGNLITYSNDFSNAAWSKVAINLTGGQSGYDGSNDAWKFESVSATNPQISQGTGDTSIKAISVYAKAGNVSELGIWVGSSKTFNLSAGTTSSSNCKITPVGATGWYRCEVFDVYTNFNPYLVATGAGEFVYIQDVQINYGTIATDYIETTSSAVYEGITDNLPRLDYSGGASCPSLLLEPSRTNGIPYSEFHDGSAFSLGANITFDGYVTSPEGVQNAARFTSSNTSSSFVQVLNTTIPAGKFTFSMWVRGVSGTFVNRSMYVPSMTGTQATMNEAPVAGEDWKLVYGTGENTTGGAINRQVTLPFYDQPNGATFDIYGFQVEAGSYPTSYIPTYGTSASRTADYSVRSDMQDYVSADEGTWFMHFKDLFFDITGTGQGSINLVHTSGNQIEFIQDGNLQYKITINNSIALQNLDGEDKVAIAWSTSGLVIYVNGVSRYTNTSSVYANPYSVFELTRVDRRPRVDMKQILFFKTRLTNAELAALTTI